LIKFYVVVGKWNKIDVPKGQYCNRKDDLDTDTLTPLGCDTPQVDVIGLNTLGIANWLPIQK